MNNLEKAQALLNAPITADTLIELDKLCAASRAEEADRIGDLWEAALVQAEQEVIDDYHASVLSEA